MAKDPEVVVNVRSHGACGLREDVDDGPSDQVLRKLVVRLAFIAKVVQ
jgi:hypothetical protein